MTSDPRSPRVVDADRDNGADARHSADAPGWGSVLLLFVALACSVCFFVMAVLRMQAQRAPLRATLSRGVTAQQDRTTAVNVRSNVGPAPTPRRSAPLADARLERFRGVPTREAKGKKQAVIPVEDRWLMEFDPGLTIGDYADQLDAIGVELGVIVDPQTIEYATKLTDSRPKKRVGKLSEEDRLYLTWSRGDLVAADRVLLANAGIDASNRVVLHFIPAATQQEMAKLEQAFAKRQAAKIQRTVFGLRETFRGYELYVKRQQERQ